MFDKGKRYSREKARQRKNAVLKRSELEGLTSPELVDTILKVNDYTPNLRSNQRGGTKSLVIGDPHANEPFLVQKHVEFDDSYWKNMKELLRTSKEKYSGNLTGSQREFVINTYLISMYGYDGKELS